MTGRPSSPLPHSVTGRRVARVSVLVVSALVLYVVVTAAQVVWASRWRTGASADAVVVLGAAQYDGRPSPVLERRLDHALDLYRAGRARRIVVTGGSRPGDRFTEAFSGFTYLRDAGVPAEDLLVITDGSTTWESLAAAQRVMRERNLGRVLLVSDPYHNLRLSLIADELGLDAELSPTDRGLDPGGVARETLGAGLGRLVGHRRLAEWSA